MSLNVDDILKEAIHGSADVVVRGATRHYEAHTWLPPPRHRDNEVIHVHRHRFDGQLANLMSCRLMRGEGNSHIFLAFALQNTPVAEETFCFSVSLATVVVDLFDPRKGKKICFTVVWSLSALYTFYGTHILNTTEILYFVLTILSINLLVYTFLNFVLWKLC